MAINIHRPRALLALFAAAVVAAGLLALVGPKPAWAAERSFALPQNFAVGSTPTTVTNADFNGDGKVDLAAQNSGSNNVSVLLGKGDGTLDPKQDFAVGSVPTSVTSTDLDGDTKADLAVANWSSNNVSILLGNGDGTFGAKQPFAARVNPSSVISADFNGDGKADLAVANYSSNDVSALLGNGDGTFQAAQNFSIQAPCTGDLCAFTAMQAPNQIITKDFNADGKADLATANVGRCGFFPQPGGISVLLGNGNGTFQNAQAYSMGTPICSAIPPQGVATSITTTDVNTDGKLDLAATIEKSNVVSVLRGNGDGTFQAQQAFTVGTRPSAVTSTDFNGDTKTDLAVSNFASDNVSVLFNNGSGSFQGAQDFPAGDGPIFVIGPDLNADSFADLAVANQNSNNISVLLNTPQPDTTAPITTRSLSPQPNANGWNKEDVTVTLNATDNDSGVKEISYSINGSQPTTVQQSSVQIPPITNEGETTISYSATDNAGNVEAEQTFTVKIDKSAPTLDTDSSDGSDGIRPNNRQTGVRRNIMPTATFSDSMDPSSLRTSAKLYQWNTVQKIWQQVPARVSVVSNKATLDPYPSDPTRLLAANKKFKVTITTGAKNLAGIALESPKGWTFTTGSR